MTPEQMRMARSALNLSLRDLAKLVDVSAAAISGYERGNETKLGDGTIDRIARMFEANRVYFGPAHGVCVGQDVFAQERWYASALFQLLKESGAIPNSTELLAAGRRAVGSNAKVSGAGTASAGLPG